MDTQHHAIYIHKAIFRSISMGRSTGLYLTRFLKLSAIRSVKTCFVLLHILPLSSLCIKSA